MAKDPAFLFYPGDYLRDTQCLSEKAQVSYDRIMCEHMRNICISEQQLKFFTKRLSDDEKEELSMTLTKVAGGFQIEWVVESIEKRRKYSESRRSNRTKKISTTYDSHMENEDENEKEITIEDRKGKFSADAFNANTLIEPAILSEVDVKDFIEYWTEHGAIDRKMRFEKQTSFSVDRRLKTWKRNLLKFNNNNNGNRGTTRKERFDKVAEDLTRGKTV